METLLTSPTFVIHLPKCQDRLPFVKEQLWMAGYTQVSVVPAVDGLDPVAVESSLAKLNHPTLDSIKPGAVGCLLSHLQVLQHIIDEEIPIANIFEDDIHFHPNWTTLSKHYYEKTPKDYEVLFVGNQILPFHLPTYDITQAYDYCMHAYVVTLEGAKKMRNMLLTYSLGKGLCEIDCMIRNVLLQNKSDGRDPPFTIYCWNGTNYPCAYNTSSPLHCRNTGLVFQNMNFISHIDDSKIIRTKQGKRRMRMI